MQSKISGRKNASYYGFLKAIGENDIPAFDERQESFIKYVSEMLPIVRPYEYLIIQKLIFGAGKEKLAEIKRHVQINVEVFEQASFDHALHYMLATNFFVLNGDELSLNNVAIGVEMDEYMRDLLEYGLGNLMEQSASFLGQNIARNRCSSCC